MTMSRIPTYAMSIIAMLLFCYFPLQVAAHACLVEPPARLAKSGPYSRMCSAQAYEMSSGNCNGGGGVGCRAPHLSKDASVCGGPFQASSWNPRDLPFSSKRSYSSGQTINLKIYYRVSHAGGTTPGWVEARLCTQGDNLTQKCFDANKLDAVGGSGKRHTVPKSQKPWVTATYAFKLPAGVSCEKCVLQYIWQTSSWDGESGEQFHNCADITIGSGSGGSKNDGEKVAKFVEEAEPSGTAKGGDKKDGKDPKDKGDDTDSKNDGSNNDNKDGGKDENDDKVDAKDAESGPDSTKKDADGDGKGSKPVKVAANCDMKVVCKTAGVREAPCECSSDCSHFLKCWGGGGRLIPCPPGLVYNPRQGACDWPRNFKCGCKGGK